MQAPNLTTQDVENLLSSIKNIGYPMKGGQKQVFPCTIEGKSFVVKFMIAGQSEDPKDENNIESADPDEAMSRAERELTIMEKADSPFLVKPGPIPLSRVSHNGNEILYFSEEKIEGTDLKSILEKNSKLKCSELIKLAMNLNEAIRVLWGFAKIHRDIKPANIIRRSNGDYVLLDLGLAFDLMDDSLTKAGCIVGTPTYYSPEQLNFANKRQMDFRSDLFALGIVLYEAATGLHPFATGVSSLTELYSNILKYDPDPPKIKNNDLPIELSDIVLRLLNKQPHMRFRSCSLLDEELKKLITDL